MTAHGDYSPATAWADLPPAHRLTRIRQRLGWSRVDVAATIGAGRTIIGSIERGTRPIHDDSTVAEILDIFGLEPACLDAEEMPSLVGRPQGGEPASSSGAANIRTDWLAGRPRLLPRQRLELARRINGVTARELAAELKTTANRIWDMEHGRLPIPHGFLGITRDVAKKIAARKRSRARARKLSRERAQARAAK